MPGPAVGYRDAGRELGAAAVAAVARPLHALVALPGLLYLATLAIMLFRPPDVDFYHLDRVAFVVLVFAVGLRVMVLRQRLPRHGALTWAMLGLLLLAIAGTAAEPFDSLTWSVLSAKFLVPFTLFHLAGLVFMQEDSRRNFQLFCFCTLAYLSFIAIAQLVGANTLIFPRYILDGSLGTHIDRARGPFLQAVANGVALNILGLLALDAFAHGRLPKPLAVIHFGALPFAILATMTRAVWISFAISIFWAMAAARSRLRRAGALLVILGVIGLLFSLLSSQFRGSLEDRVEERGPVEIRVAIYRTSWDMIREKPWLGWGQNQMAGELGRRLPGYNVDTLAAHNNYLEIVVEHGGVGLALYGCVIVGLFRLAFRHSHRPPSDAGLHDQLYQVWPIILSVYLLNGCFVVMNYQFVNALLFTTGGILSAQNQECLELPR